MSFNFIGLGIGLVVTALVTFGVLQWFHVPAGSFMDWVIGLASFWWLLAITIVPWNIHFEARETLAEAAQSQAANIPVDRQQIQYVNMVARRSLWVAIMLHSLSTIGLYLLSATGISAIGYIGSGAALLLTVLRPAVRTYGYLAARLTLIRGGFKYPREDVVELRQRVAELEAGVKLLTAQLDPEDPRSWVTTQQRQLEATRSDLTRLAAALEEERTLNQAAHVRLSRETEQSIAQLSTDGQFLDHVREIIRFFKTA